MKIIRLILGQLIIMIDFLTRPKAMKRDAAQQIALNKVTANFKLYQFKACPFCVKVRRKIHQLHLDIEVRDAKNDIHYRKELAEQGGKTKVPCLRIKQDNGSFKWLYESDDINAYLAEIAEAH